MKKGDAYRCDVCGLAASVDEVCNCVYVRYHLLRRGDETQELGVIQFARLPAAGKRRYRKPARSILLTVPTKPVEN
ncbi:MAG: hypothetical protein PHT96_12465 [Syntrophorhabdaceae bacterium]|nr:hypothetical protein [Syntrophorhabdaceae bacterium]MDD4197200.1 hypothetical protein [Syntrophorhabdaceae bacterium]